MFTSGKGIRWSTRQGLLACAIVALLGLNVAAASAASTRNVSVTGNDTGDCVSAPCQTIQYAVDEADPGDTVAVAAGTFDEPQVIVDQALTLRGAGAGETIVDGSSANALPHAGTFYFDGPSSGDIEVSGFTLQGANAKNGSAEPMLLVFSNLMPGGEVVVTDNEFIAEAEFDPEIATDFSLGLYVGSAEADLEITDNSFRGMWQGILLENSAGATIVSANEFSELVPTVAGEDSYPGEGVFVLATGANGNAGEVSTSQVVSENSFHDYAGFGIAFQSGHHSVDPTTPNSFSDVTVAGNQIDLGGSIFPTTDRPLPGVLLKTDQDESTIEDAEIVGNTIAVSAPGNDIGVEGEVSGTEIRLNRLAGSPAAGVDASLASGTVVATDNWWGCNEGPGAPACTTVSGEVDDAPNLVLSGAASSSQVETGGSATISATLDTNSDGETVPLVPAGGEPVVFEAGLGSMAPVAAPLLEGFATSTFTAGSQAGDAGVTVGLDNQLVSVPLSVVAPPAPTPPTPVPPAPTPPVGNPPVIKVSSGDSTKTVPPSGQVTVGTVSCPSGTCDVVAKSPKMTIGGKSYRVTVKVRRQIAAGDSSSIKVVLSRAARAALAKEGKGRLSFKITVTTSTGTTRTVTVKVKLTGKGQGGKAQ
ncbi:MAG TPA: right-handed parallel beta-helix repeat-containing protein [Solirubrobacterales bacterium]|nr:right-handed parallel beta-helix repeat-containing protein [Solirubrobacterales bacterium]